MDESAAPVGRPSDFGELIRDIPVDCSWVLQISPLAVTAAENIGVGNKISTLLRGTVTFSLVNSECLRHVHFSEICSSVPLPRIYPQGSDSSRIHCVNGSLVILLLTSNVSDEKSLRAVIAASIARSDVNNWV